MSQTQSDPMDRDRVEEMNTQEWENVPDEQEWNDDDWLYWCRSKSPSTATELLRIWEVLP